MIFSHKPDEERFEVVHSECPSAEKKTWTHRGTPVAVIREFKTLHIKFLAVPSITRDFSRLHTR